MLTAADPGACGFMADECLLAIPEIEGIDYTTKELLNFVEQLKAAANRSVCKISAISYICYFFIKLMNELLKLLCKNVVCTAHRDVL